MNSYFRIIYMATFCTEVTVFVSVSMLPKNVVRKVRYDFFPNRYFGLLTSILIH